MEKVKKQLSELKSLIESIELDAQKFDKGNDTAGARMRKASKELANKAIDFRKIIQDEREARK